MVNVCRAPGCTNKSTQDTSVSYHRFPANKKLQGKWLRSPRRETLEVNKSTRVCSAHFKNGNKSSRTDVPYVRSPSFVPQPMQHRKPVTRLCGNDDNTIDDLENDFPRDESAYSTNQDDDPEDPMACDYSDKVTNLDENLYSVYPSPENNDDDEYMPIPMQPMRLEHVY